MARDIAAEHLVASGIVPMLAQLLPAVVPPTTTLEIASLTTFQVEFLQVAISAREYQFARDVVHGTWPRPNGSSTTEVKDVLRYYYLRGIIYMVLTEYNMAARCFRAVLAVPATVISAVQVAAWKKAVLVQCVLLEDAHFDNATAVLDAVLPKASSAAVAKYFKQPNNNNTNRRSSSSNSIFDQQFDQHYQQYHQLLQLAPEESVTDTADEGSQQQFSIQAYANLALAFMRNETINTNHAVLEQDGNMGMVRRLVETHAKRRKVLYQSRIYARISLNDLSALTNVPQSELQEVLSQLSVELGWAIQVQEGVVAFPKLPPKQVPMETDDWNALTHMVRTLDVLSQPKYAVATKRDGQLLGPQGFVY
jgi:hypothetical protein